MARTFSHSLSVCLIGGGALVWGLTGQPLLHDEELRTPLNALGINHSPYGEVFAMAMQGSIETYYHGATASGAHIHADGEECSACSGGIPPISSSSSSGFGRLQSLLSYMGKAHTERTNPKPPSAAQRFFLRRQAEDKLRFAYNLDPSHYGNYTALHFFLTEPQVGTRPELTPSALKLADNTISYCLAVRDDPRPILTAAAACTNVIHLMFDDRNIGKTSFSTEQMRSYLAQLNQCMSRYEQEAIKWEQSKQWDLISPQRIAELQDRHHFVSKVREAAEQTIQRIESEEKALSSHGSPEH